MDYPLVSVVILNHNRREELRETLSLLRALSYKPMETIVVDNNSGDESGEMVARDFPSVILIRLSENIGIAGWNEGFAIAKGAYTLALDDDSAPVEGALEYAVDRMTRNPDTGIFAFHVVNKNDELSETDSYPERPITFVGCGVLIRTSMFATVGFFSPFLFLYMHEIDFAIRAVNAGYRILHDKNAVVRHRLAPSHRDQRGRKHMSMRKAFYDNRNTILILCRYFPLRTVFFRIMRIAAGRLFHALRHGYLLTLVKAYLSALRAAPAILRDRQLVNAETQAAYSYGAFAGGFFFTGAYGFSRPRFLGGIPEMHQ
jgi:GT2 family glycosyltransferase